MMAPLAPNKPAIEPAEFRFSLNQNVKISVSGESGHVIGRAEYEHTNSNYLLHYKCADGRAVEAWWSEETLEPDESTPAKE